MLLWAYSSNEFSQTSHMQLK